MKRRIFAWVLLALFALLLLNIIVIRIYWQLSMVIYLIIAFAFILTEGRRTKPQYYDVDLNFKEGNDEADLDIETDSNNDTDTDTLADTETDRVRDTDTDTDTNADVNTDTDADTDSVTDSDTSTDTNSKGEF